ncbi:MAG TPA: hypothetical protein DCL44_03345 [Elusimicrobia bacterium]|nr:hypothetical protein [Elusimicrobiota bacterium]
MAGALNTTGRERTMKIPTLKVSRNVLSLLTAAFLFVRPAFCALLPSGGGYQIASSVIDNGGGAKLSGGEYALKGSIGQNDLPPGPSRSNGGDYSKRKGFYDPPHFTYQSGLATTLVMGTGDVQLFFPANSVNKEVFDITLNKNPLYQPISIDPSKITDASQKMLDNEGGWAQLLPSNMSEMAIFDEQSYFTDTLANKGTMSMRYKDDNDDGILDDSDPSVRVDTLNTWLLDESVNSWVMVPGLGVDKESKTLTAYFGLAGVYALIGTLDTTVTNVKAYPVPFRPNGPQAGLLKGQTGTEAKGIIFESLPQTGRIEIYTLDGRLVRKLATPTSGPAVMSWNVKTASGEKVASGVYIWRVISGANVKTGKLMVIW